MLLYIEVQLKGSQPLSKKSKFHGSWKDQENYKLLY